VKIEIKSLLLGIVLVLAVLLLMGATSSAPPTPRYQVAEWGGRPIVIDQITGDMYMGAKAPATQEDSVGIAWYKLISGPPRDQRKP
jgi:hypothetical protein